MFAEIYKEYFTTPYFVFIRDTLSYMAMIGLHFALCLEASKIPFSGLEWAILFFFLGRILMESQQFLYVKVEQHRETNWCCPTKVVTFLYRCRKYFRYQTLFVSCLSFSFFPFCSAFFRSFSHFIVFIVNFLPRLSSSNQLPDVSPTFSRFWNSCI